jgi:hypothetical protein
VGLAVKQQRGPGGQQGGSGKLRRTPILGDRSANHLVQTRAAAPARLPPGGRANRRRGSSNFDPQRSFGDGSRFRSNDVFGPPCSCPGTPSTYLHRTPYLARRPRSDQRSPSSEPQTFGRARMSTAKTSVARLDRPADRRTLRRLCVFVHRIPETGPTRCVPSP